MYSFNVPGCGVTRECAGATLAALWVASDDAEVAVADGEAVDGRVDSGAVTADGVGFLGLWLVMIATAATTVARAPPINAFKETLRPMGSVLGALWTSWVALSAELII